VPPPVKTDELIIYKIDAKLGKDGISAVGTFVYLGVTNCFQRMAIFTFF